VFSGLRPRFRCFDPNCKLNHPLSDFRMNSTVTSHVARQRLPSPASYPPCRPSTATVNCSLRLSRRPSSIASERTHYKTPSPTIPLLLRHCLAARSIAIAPVLLRIYGPLPSNGYPFWFHNSCSEQTCCNTKDSFYEELERAFYIFPKYHVIILLGDFNAKVGREAIFKPTIRNESLH
jgi:hypothetical protein